MKLFLGGFAQGKTEYVKGLFPGVPVFDENSFEELLSENQGDVVILNHLHLLIRHFLEQNQSEALIREKINTIIAQYPNIIVICDEVGNGIVPVSGFERDYRELTGRITIDIAKKSESVERIICQIPVKLK